MLSTMWSKFHMGEKSPAQVSSPALPSTPDPAQIGRPHAKCKVSDKFGIMLWFPVTVGLAPVVPAIAEPEGSKWIDKYLNLKPRQKRERRRVGDER